MRVDPGPDDGVKTSLAVASLAAGVATYDFRIEWDIGALAPLPVETRCLHTGSLATVLAPGRADVEDLMEREHQRGRVTVSYDPNVRPALLGTPEEARPGIERLVAISDVVKVSDEDLQLALPRPAGRGGGARLARAWPCARDHHAGRQGRLRRHGDSGAAPAGDTDRPRGHRGCG